MANYNQYFIRMQDGTIKQINPFTGTEVWTVPGRGNKPLSNAINIAPKLIEKKEKEDYCNFCETKYMNTPPEKERLVRHDKQYLSIENAKASELNLTKPAFRRIPNLFEIVTIDYWKKNFNFTLSEEEQKVKKAYMSEKEGYDHVMNVVNLKLKLLGKDAATTSIGEKLDMADAFFGGGHELVVGGRHFTENAVDDNQLYSSGEMTHEAHFEYFKFTIKGMESIYKNNKYVRYVSIFQNWLKGGGASFDHLHKQLVAIDEWGVSVEREIALLRKSPNIYNEMAVNLAIHFNLVIAENEYAIAFSDIGHRYPTIAINSKSEKAHPYEMDEKELKGFSDIVHAVHAAVGSQVACNEEWYYTPRDTTDVMPWHILIKLRINMPAGFEGGTKIYINPVDPYDLRDKLIMGMHKARFDGKIDKAVKIGDECDAKPNCLMYYKKYYKS
ncbi:MAG: DUF4921 family protein [bacterium]